MRKRREKKGGPWGIICARVEEWKREGGGKDEIRDSKF